MSLSAASVGWTVDRTVVLENVNPTLVPRETAAPKRERREKSA